MAKGEKVFGGYSISFGCCARSLRVGGRLTGARTVDQLRAQVNAKRMEISARSVEKSIARTTQAHSDSRYSRGVQPR